jgi:hypothetical protein
VVATGMLASFTADLPSLSYTANAGATSDTLVLTDKDTADGLSSTTVDVSVTVTSLAPTVSAPTVANVYHHHSLHFSAARGNAITLSDPAASGNSDSLTLTATHGIVKLGSTKGITFSSGRDRSSSMTVTGTLDDLNAALDGLKFTPRYGFCGSASLVVTLTDSGDKLSGSATISIVVNSARRDHDRRDQRDGDGQFGGDGNQYQGYWDSVPQKTGFLARLQRLVAAFGNRRLNGSQTGNQAVDAPAAEQLQPLDGAGYTAVVSRTSQAASTQGQPWTGLGLRDSKMVLSNSNSNLHNQPHAAVSSTVQSPAMLMDEDALQWAGLTAAMQILNA